MGTTQRIHPGVSGEPNWGQLSRSISAIGANLKLELDVRQVLDNAEDDAEQKPNEEIVRLTKRKHVLDDRLEKHFRAAMKSLIQTGGGRDAVTKGRSPSLGRSGRRTARRLVSFVNAVHRQGLAPTLQEAGFGEMRGRSVQDVLDFLLIYFADTASGMDEVAANMASCQVLEWLSADVENLEDLQARLQRLIDENSLTELIARFYGLYLFEHLSQRFEEKLTQLLGETVSRETFNLIREDIIGRVEHLARERDLSNINWRAADGRKMADAIFNSIINIFE